MYFTLKLLRLFGRLVRWFVMLPVTLLRWLVGLFRSSDEDEPTDPAGADSAGQAGSTAQQDTDTEATTPGAKPTAAVSRDVDDTPADPQGLSDDRSLPDGAPGQPQYRRYRYSLYLLGVVSLAGTVMLVSGLPPYMEGDAVLIFAVLAAIAAIPLILGFRARRQGKVVWALGLLYAALLVNQQVLEVLGGIDSLGPGTGGGQDPIGLLLSGLVFVLVAATLYFGIRGRHAVTGVGSDATPSPAGSPGSVGAAPVPSTSTGTASQSGTGAAIADGDRPATGAVAASEPVDPDASNESGPSTAEPRSDAAAVTDSGPSAERSPPDASGEDETDDGSSEQPGDQVQQTKASSTEEAKATGVGAGGTPGREPDDGMAAESSGPDQADATPADAASTDGASARAERLCERLASADDPDPETIREIGDVVEPGGGEEVVDVIASFTDHDDPAVRLATCEVLGEFEDESARAALRRCRVDPDDRVSRAALDALAGG